MPMITDERMVPQQDSDLIARLLGEDEREVSRVSHASGASSSHFSPFDFLNPFEGSKLTSQRFRVGNAKYENSDTVYANCNWLKALRARDVKFFRDRAGHALEHLIAEMRGEDDPDPGGNLGAVGWCLEVLAYVKKQDPHLYGAIQGKWSVDSKPDQKIS